jgi:hypothetical protein
MLPHHRLRRRTDIKEEEEAMDSVGEEEVAMTEDEGGRRLGRLVMGAMVL